MDKKKNAATPKQAGEHQSKERTCNIPLLMLIRLQQSQQVSDLASAEAAVVGGRAGASPGVAAEQDTVVLPFAGTRPLLVLVQALELELELEPGRVCLHLFRGYWISHVHS